MKHPDFALMQDVSKGELRVSLWADRGKSGVVYNPGDTTRLYLTSNKDCYIYILNFWGSGNVRMLFPTGGADNCIRGEREYDFADDFGIAWVAEPPCGHEIIKVIACVSPLNIDETQHSFELIESLRGMAEVSKTPYPGMLSDLK